jgi:LPXTG-site transpeptidase (sortase) family protein
VLKASLIVGVLCLAVGGFLTFTFMTQDASDSQAGASNLAPVATPDPTSERTIAAPLPEKTFTEADKDVYAPPTDAASIALTPMSLSIPSVGISTSIVSGGESNGSMILPESSKVAIYTAAAPLTADKGSTVIAGHVNFADGSAGALGPLHNISKGAPVYATDGEGNVRKYKVTSMSVLNKQALIKNIFRTAGDRQLVVVTCGGDVEKVNGVYVYTHNLVVTADPV